MFLPNIPIPSPPVRAEDVLCFHKQPKSPGVHQWTSPRVLSGSANGSGGPIFLKLLHNFYIITTSQVWCLLLQALFLPATGQRWCLLTGKWFIQNNVNCTGLGGDAWD